MKIIIVGMTNSVHLVRWVEFFYKFKKFKIFVFPIAPVKIHPKLFKISNLNSKLSNINIFNIVPNINFNFFIQKILYVCFKNYFYLLALNIWINRIKPKYLHSHELTLAGVLCLKLKLYRKKLFPKWIVTNWGSDLFYFYKTKKLKKYLKKIIHLSDYYSAECNRDYKLANNIGFKGSYLPCIPNSGGINFSLAKRLRLIQKPSHRKIIVIKGYQDEIGHAKNAILALNKIVDKIQNFEIVIFSANSEIINLCKKIKLSQKIQLKIIGKNTTLCQQDMYNLFARSKIYIGISKSDGISTSMLEAIALGTFPIQSDTSCGNEWIKNNISGFLVPWNDINIISNKILKVINDNVLIEKSAKLNWDVVKKKGLDINIKKIAHTFYHQ